MTKGLVKHPFFIRCDANEMRSFTRSYVTVLEAEKAARIRCAKTGKDVGLFQRKKWSDELFAVIVMDPMGRVWTEVLGGIGMEVLL